MDRSANTPWYDGPSLLELLETLPVADELETELEPLRLPVQLVIRPQGALAPDVAARPEAERFRDYRAFAGRIESGTVRVGDPVEVFPAGIDDDGRRHRRGAAPSRGHRAAVGLAALADHVDAARRRHRRGGVAPRRARARRRRVPARRRPSRPGARVLVKHGTSTVQALVTRSSAPRPRHARPRAGRRRSRRTTSATRAAEARGRPRRRAVRRTPPGGAFLVIHPHDGATLAAGIVTEGRFSMTARPRAIRTTPLGGGAGMIRTARRNHRPRPCRWRGDARAVPAPAERGARGRGDRHARRGAPPRLLRQRHPRPRARRASRRASSRTRLGDTDVTTQVFNAGPAAIEALTAGAIDATYIGPNPSINTFIQSGGESARIVAGAATGGAALVVQRRDRQRRTTSPARRSPRRSSATRRTSRCAVARRRGLRDRHHRRRRREHHADRERADAHALPAGRPRRRLAARAVGLAPDRRRRRPRARRRGRPVGGRRVPDHRAARARRVPRGAPRDRGDLLEGHVGIRRLDRRQPRRGAGRHQRARSRPRRASRSPTRSSRGRSST